MTTKNMNAAPARPERLVRAPLPPLPDVSAKSSDEASTEYSHYRTGLSHHRTELSEHRTDLSEFRTDLSTNRTDMSMRRTGMSIHRTRMSADRTLMAEIRTSLSLIGFGFTIYKAFEQLYKAGAIGRDEAPRNFGVALIVLGIIIICGGIWRHVQFALELRNTRLRLIEQGLIYGESAYPLSVSFVVAVLLLLIGLAAILSIGFG